MCSHDLVPAFSRIAPFGWFIGAALGALAYYFIARGRLPILPEGAPVPEGARPAPGEPVS
jgi:hypothetical protein